MPVDRLICLLFRASFVFLLLCFLSVSSSHCFTGRLRLYSNNKHLQYLVSSSSSNVLVDDFQEALDREDGYQLHVTCDEQLVVVELRCTRVGVLVFLCVCLVDSIDLKRAVKTTKTRQPDDIGALGRSER